MNSNIKLKKLLELRGLEKTQNKKEKKRCVSLHSTKNEDLVKNKSERISVAKIVKIKYIFPQKRKKC